ncbi:hypothetical protein SAMN05421847_2940 [Halpernia humi]|uniref:Uncharacterized protein n=1 Tax=Halpernia humi TaxID=493375 RepID=A0A1H6BJT1_9FLAO|nr:hypothetical protein [Halpernia humi]SEG60953.1 hypothetical protein SAMN05421847_2940 [Halpernia humi]
MATKADIITNIDAKIISKGNILATDTNAILKDILNCDELNSGNTNSLETFQYNGDLTDASGAIVSYSIRGITDLFANITLQIGIKQTLQGKLSLLVNNRGLFNSLNSIIKNNENTIDFLVKIRNNKSAEIYRKLEIQPAKKFRIANLNFTFNARSLIILIESQELNDNLFAGDSISASFAIHNS